MFCLGLPAAWPAKGQYGGGEPPPAEPDRDVDATKPNAAGTDHGKQGPVPCRGATVYVSSSGEAGGVDSRTQKK